MPAAPLQGGAAPSHTLGDAAARRKGWQMNKASNLIAAFLLAAGALAATTAGCEGTVQVDSSTTSGHGGADGGVAASGSGGITVTGSGGMATSSSSGTGGVTVTGSGGMATS